VQSNSQETLTFVVRLWREAGQDRWRGRVEHVASQEVGYVEDVEGVAHFIERWTKPGEEGMPMQTNQGDVDKAISWTAPDSSIM
jgi:hypothetical protein